MEIKVITGAIDGHKLGEIAEYPDEIAETLVSLGLAEPVGEPAAEPIADAGDAETGNLGAKTLGELKELCREMSLPTSGKKDDLVARIADAQAAEGEGLEDGEAEDDEPPALNAEVPQ